MTSLTRWFSSSPFLPLTCPTPNGSKKRMNIKCDDKLNPSRHNVPGLKRKRPDTKKNTSASNTSRKTGILHELPNKFNLECDSSNVVVFLTYMCVISKSNIIQTRDPFHVIHRPCNYWQIHTSLQSRNLTNKIVPSQVLWGHGLSSRLTESTATLCTHSHGTLPFTTPSQRVTGRWVEARWALWGHLN